MTGQRYLVLWWMEKKPYRAEFENRVAAEAAASARNALLVTLSGNRLRVDSVVDFFRRDEDGAPMPAETRDLIGQVRVPWLSRGAKV